MDSSALEHMAIDVFNPTGHQVIDSDDTMGSNSDYYSANEGEKQVRMDMEPTHNTLTLNFGTSANIDPSQATFSFGVSTNTVPSHVANESPESTVS
jgi:hypothetical protein